MNTLLHPKHLNTLRDPKLSKRYIKPVLGCRHVRNTTFSKGIATYNLYYHGFHKKIKK